MIKKDELEYREWIRSEIKRIDKIIKEKLKQKNYTRIFRFYLEKKRYINELNRRFYDNSYNRLDRKR